MKTKEIKGYKGFDKDMKCRNFQYEVGKEYETDKVEVCRTGFHMCENPMEVLNYYPPVDDQGNLNRFCEVVGSGDIKRSKDNTKVACTKIRIGAEIKLSSIIEAGVKFILERIKYDDNPQATNTGNHSAATNTGNYSAATNTGNHSAATNTGNHSAATNTGYHSAATNTGYYSAATNTGYHSAATNTGDYSAATNTGNYSAATNTGYHSAATNTGYHSAATNTGDYSAATNTGYHSAATNTGYHSAATNTGNYSAATNTGNYSAAIVDGKDSVAIVTGYNSKAKGALGCWIVLTERDEWNGNTCPIKEVKAFCVDNDTIKVDTFYKLVDGKAVECE